MQVEFLLELASRINFCCTLIVTFGDRSRIGIFRRARPVGKAIRKVLYGRLI